MQQQAAGRSAKTLRAATTGFVVVFCFWKSVRVVTSVVPGVFIAGVVVMMMMMIY